MFSLVNSVFLSSKNHTYPFTEYNGNHLLSVTVGQGLILMLFLLIRHHFLHFTDAETVMDGGKLFSEEYPINWQSGDLKPGLPISEAHVW